MRPTNLDGYEVLMRFKPLPPLYDFDNIPDECAIVKVEGDNGIMGLGLYHGEWHANTSERPIIRYLLAEIERLNEVVRIKGGGV